MADDRTLAPGPARWHRAWRAGLRLRSRWLVPALACGLLAVALDSLPMEPGAWGLDVRPHSGARGLGDWWDRTVMSVGALWIGAGGVVLLVAMLGRQLGTISATARRRLGAAPPSPSVMLSLGLAIGVGLAVVGSLTGVLAAAARSVDASEAGLSRLWWGWAANGAGLLAVGLSLAALGELVLERWELGRRLGRSPQQVRDEARASGAG